MSQISVTYNGNTIPYLSFTSPASFTVESNAGTKTWTNQLEYSTDGQSWSEWDGSTISSGVHKGSNAIYMRGTGNQVISGGEDDNNRWNFTGSDITISGNIEWILDYQTVMNGQHPVMGTYCYRSLFYGNAALISCPELPATNLTDSCYRSMFDRCTSIVNPPELPATVMAPNCYRSMFYSGTSLVAAPEINAVSLAEACFKYMFWGCTKVTNLIRLTPLTFPKECCQSMYQQAGVKLSKTQTESYTVPYRLPVSGKGTAGTNAFQNMFGSTKGTFAGTPTINTTYYVNVPKEESLKFSSPNSFTLQCDGSPGWDGVVEYSVDGQTWEEWDGSSLTTGSANELYLRGTGNTVITGSSGYSSRWVITGSNVSCEGNIESLLDHRTVENGGHPTMGDNCFDSLFYECEALVSVPSLPATTLTSNCYANMFYFCTSILEVPTDLLPATTLAHGCYGDMFYGCTSLKNVPALPAVTLADYCYGDMFYGCSSLKFSSTQDTEYSVPYRIPQSGTGVYAEEALNYMFSETKGLFAEDGTPSINTTYYTRQVPSASSTSYVLFSSNSSFSVEGYSDGGHLEYSLNGDDWYRYSNNSQIESDSNNTIYLRGVCNSVLSSSWTISGSDVSCSGNIESLFDYICVESHTHPEVGESCCESMFIDCTALTSAPDLMIENVPTRGYAGMFAGCTSLVNSPVIGAVSLGSSACKEMFRYCDALVTAPSFPNLVSVSAYTCYNMFEGCYALTTLPSVIPATNLDISCYNSMFSYCENLTSIPSDLLPATTLAEACYTGMFQGCTSLVHIPSQLLPATTLGAHCYESMFEGCTSIQLLSSGLLPATTLADSCYRRMFMDCTGLLRPAEIPATSYSQYACFAMFSGCENIKVSEDLDDDYVIPYRIPSSGTGDDGGSAFESMFTSTGGLFTGTPETNRTYYLYAVTSHGYVRRLQVQPPQNPYLTFSSPSPFTVSTNYIKPWEGTMEYSTDAQTWSEWDGIAELQSGPDNTLYLRGTGNTVVSEYEDGWSLTGSNISCTGNIENLLDYQTVANGNHPTMGARCYDTMFRNCTSLISAPDLPATTLADYCYANMFCDCTSLISAPLLPATMLADNCYAGMFEKCTSLTVAPELPATTLADYCYGGMFNDCTALTTPPELPATTLAKNCYIYMFSGCTALTTPPSLPATTLAENCYMYMFSGCTALTTPPALPATALATCCYEYMFSSCESFTIPPELPATTLAERCYACMFSDCTSLTALPELPAISLADSCYVRMFEYCTSIKLSITQTGDYQTPYRIPSTSTGTAGSYSMQGMFADTSGTFTGTPTINTPYYTSNTIIPTN